MRLLFSIISVAATGYLVYVVNGELRPAGAPSAPTPAVALVEPVLAPAETAPPASDPAPEASTPETPAHVAIAPAPARAVPGVRVAPAGSFYITQRVSVENSAGVIAVLPGELVTLVYRNKDGTARVKWGAHSLTVREAQIAREFDPTAKPPPATSRLLGQRD
jgi:hypothetical protein